MDVEQDSVDREARRGRGPSARSAGAAAVLEALAAFAAVHFTYRVIKQFTPIGAWEGAVGSNFTPGVVTIAFTAAALLLCRRNFADYGLTLERWQDNLSLGLVCTMATVSFGGVGLLVSRYAYDPTRPPDPSANPAWGRLGVACGFVAGGFLTALAIAAYRGRLFRSIPAFLSIPLIIGLIATLPIAALALKRPSMWPTALWLFFGAGFGEEVFYRGYIQSRIDSAFGWPCKWLGFEFGLGLLISSLLFGLVHALNTFDYFHGRYDFGWRMGLETVFAGLFCGLLRARTGSILPGAIEHGLSDVLVRIPNLVSGFY